MLDRVGQRPVLVSLALTFAAVLASIALSAAHAPVVVTIGLAAIAGISRPPLESAMRALWAWIVPARHLQAAYALDAVGQDLIWLGGPLLLSVLLVVGDARTALLACAACTVLGTLGYVATSRVPGNPEDEGEHAGHARLRSRVLRSLLAAAALYGISMGAFEIALTAFCTRHGARSAVGVLLAVWSVGSIVGGLVYGTRAWRRDIVKRVSLLLGALAALLAALTVASDVWTLAALLFAMGLPTAPFTSTLSAAVGDLSPPARRNEGFTWMTAMVTSGIAVGNAATGPLIQFDPALGFPFAAVAAAAGALLGLGGLRAAPFGVREPRPTRSTSLGREGSSS